MPYASLSELKEYLGITSTDTDDDVLLGEMLDEATRIIDMETGYSFESTTDTRYYEEDALAPSDSYLLRVDEPLLSVSELLNGDSDSTEITSSDYWLWPRNEGPPYWGIKLKVIVSSSWQWSADYFVTVTGTWGYASTPPDDIKLACRRLATYLYQQKDNPIYETTIFPEQGAVVTPTGLPDDVERIVRKYRYSLMRGW